jgi:hypothetical protein
VPARSRKRGRRGPVVAGQVRPAGLPQPAGQAQPGGRPQPGGQPPRTPGPPRTGAPHRSRSEERNAAVRATLTPLAPGERPWPLRVAVLVALLIAVADLLQVALGSTVKFGQTHTSVGGVALFSVIMFVCAVGMWRLRYWAVLGFMALLALLVIAFALALVAAKDVLGAAIALAIIAGAGYLFFKLVRVVSRLQLPSSGPPG